MTEPTNTTYPAALDSSTEFGAGLPDLPPVYELDGDITSAQTSIKVTANISGYSAPNWIRINSEVIHFTGIATDTFTGCTRGAAGTSSSGHTASDDVYLVITGQMLDILVAAMIAVQTELGINPAGSLTDVVTRLAVILNNNGTLKQSTLVGIADNKLVEIDSASVADNEIARFTAAGLESRSDAEMKTQLGYMQDLSDDTAPTVGGDMDMDDKDLHNMKQVDFKEYHDAGTSGTVKTIDWNEGNKQKLQITGNACDLSQTDPAGACALELRLIGDGTLRTNIDADHDDDCGWADGAEPDAYGSANNVVIGTLFFTYDPSSTPKYLVAAVSRGAV